jgi:hypothetical protein
MAGIGAGVLLLTSPASKHVPHSRYLALVGGLLAAGSILAIPGAPKAAGSS